MRTALTRSGYRWVARLGTALLWVAGAVLVDVLIGSRLSLVGLFAAGPLLACAFLSPAATMSLSVTAAAFTAACEFWLHHWNSEQQAIRLADVVVIGMIAVAVAAIGQRREAIYARLVSAEATARKRADVAGAQFTAALDRAPLGIALLDDRHTVIRANPEMARLTGRDVKRLVGLPWTDLIIPDAETTPTRSGPYGMRETQLSTADGELRWVACRASPVDGVSGVHLIEHVEDITERKRYEERLAYLADHDPLTGQYNRRRFYEELARQVDRDRRAGETSTVMLIDLDGFEYINDTLGHATGDELIQVIAAGLRARMRSSDVLGRLGGDEFGVLLLSTDPADAATVAAGLLDSIRTTEVRRAGQRVRSTASIGVAEAAGASMQDVNDIVANADLAMYAAKESGRDTFVTYDPQGAHARQARSHYRWLNRIRHALETDGFVLHLQPILEVATGAVTGGELLLRMRNGKELVAPGQFLPVAERHGLATAIDRYVIGQAYLSQRPTGSRRASAGRSTCRPIRSPNLTSPT